MAGLRRTPRRDRWMALAAMLALVVSACGGDDAPETAESPPAPPAAAPEAPEPEPEPEPEPAPVVEGDAELVWSVTFDDKIQSLVAHPDGERLLVGTDATYVLQLADGYMLDAIVYWYASVVDLDVSPDGNLVGAAIHLGGVPLTTIDGEIPPGLEGLDQHRDYQGARFHGGYDNNLSFSPNGVHLASGNRAGEVWIYNLDTVVQVATLRVDDLDDLGLGGILMQLVYHPSGELIATVNLDARVDVWNVASEQVLHQFDQDIIGGAPLAFSPDGRLMATAISEDRVRFVRIWTVDGFEPVLDLDMDVRNFGDLMFSPDGSLLATAAWRMPPTVWDVATGAPLHGLDSGIDPNVGRDGDGWYHPTAVTFTPDGGHVVAGYYDGTLELWRLPGAQVLVAPEREVCEPLPLPGDVLFDTGSSVLRTEADPALTTLAGQLRAGFDDATLTFVGHTDSRGDAASNQQLSLARAEAVRDWFATWAADNGVDGWMLAVDGRGDTQLRVPDTGPDGQFLPEAGAMNRRVEIEIDADGCLP